jgi:hypothetical protein
VRTFSNVNSELLLIRTDGLVCFLSRLAESVRSAAKRSRCSYRERSDSGYESDEDIEHYLQDVIRHYQNNEQIVHVYPALHGPRSPSSERRGTIFDDSASSTGSTLSQSRRSSIVPQRYVQRSMSMSPQKTRRVSSVRHSQTLKPIIHRRSTILDSSIGSLIRVVGSPRLNNDNETYISTRFRNKDTSKFVIGTLWNTFALVNNLFLQRPRKRRNAIAGDTNIQAEQLAHLERLYSLAEQNQADEMPFEQTESLVTPAAPKARTASIIKTNHLHSVVFDVLSSTQGHHCTCYESQHLSSCPFYDHSAPYIRPFSGRTSRLEGIFSDIKKNSQVHWRDVSTQSPVAKPTRMFTHHRPSHSVATQSSPKSSSASTFKSRQSHAYTQYGPMSNEGAMASFPSATTTKVDPFERTDATTQYSPINPIKRFNDSSTQSQPTSGDTHAELHRRTATGGQSLGTKHHIYVNVPPSATSDGHRTKGVHTSTQSEPQFERDIRPANSHATTQYSPVKNESIATQIPHDAFKSNIVDKQKLRPRDAHTDDIVRNETSRKNDRTGHAFIDHTRHIDERTEVSFPSSPNDDKFAEYRSTRKSDSPHTVRGLVSIFEPNSSARHDSLTLNKFAMSIPLVDKSYLHVPSESAARRHDHDETQSSMAYDTIEQYASEVASTIVDNAVLTATTTTVHHHDQQDQRRRFSVYNSSGGHGKNLLFQSNTFLPTADAAHRHDDNDEHHAELQGISSVCLVGLTRRIVRALAVPLVARIRIASTCLVCFLWCSFSRVTRIE